MQRIPRYIVLVEDYYQQAELICMCLELAFPDVRVGRITTEHEFRSRLDELAASPPDLIILDVILRWTDPSRDLDSRKPPDEIKDAGPHRAGIRCAELLSKRKETKDIPVIFYTILERQDLSDYLNHGARRPVHLLKEPDPDILTAAILSLLNDNDGLTVH